VKVIYSAPNLALAGYVKQALEDNGIRCRLRNEFLAGAMGELPPIECWPQVCIDDAALEAQALALVDELLTAGDRPGPSWRCGGCGELIEGHFAACWQCGQAQD